MMMEIYSVFFQLFNIDKFAEIKGALEVTQAHRRLNGSTYHC